MDRGRRVLYLQVYSILSPGFFLSLFPLTSQSLTSGLHFALVALTKIDPISGHARVFRV